MRYVRLILTVSFIALSLSACDSQKNSSFVFDNPVTKPDFSYNTTSDEAVEDSSEDDLTEQEESKDNNDTNEEEVIEPTNQNIFESNELLQEDDIKKLNNSIECLFVGVLPNPPEYYDYTNQSSTIDFAFSGLAAYAINNYENTPPKSFEEVFDETGMYYGGYVSTQNISKAINTLFGDNGAKLEKKDYGPFIYFDEYDGFYIVPVGFIGEVKSYPVSIDEKNDQVSLEVLLLYMENPETLAIRDFKNNLYGEDNYVSKSSVDFKDNIDLYTRYTFTFSNDKIIKITQN